MELMSQIKYCFLLLLLLLFFFFCNETGVHYLFLKNQSRILENNETL